MYPGPRRNRSSKRVARAETYDLIPCAAASHENNQSLPFLTRRSSCGVRAHVGQPQPPHKTNSTLRRRFFFLERFIDFESYWFRRIERDRELRASPSRRYGSTAYMHTRCVCWLSRSTRCDPSLWIGVSVAARRHGLGPSFAALSLHRWRLNCRLCRPLLHPCNSGPHPPHRPMAMLWDRRGEHSSRGGGRLFTASP